MPYQRRAPDPAAGAHVQKSKAHSSDATSPPPPPVSLAAQAATTAEAAAGDAGTTFTKTVDVSLRGDCIDAFLTALDLERHRVAAQGSCLFSSIAKGLNVLGKRTPKGTQYNAKSVRQAMNQWVQSNPTFVLTPGEGGNVWARYLDEFYQEDDKTMAWSGMNVKTFFTKAFNFTAGALSLPKKSKKNDPTDVVPGYISKIKPRLCTDDMQQSDSTHSMFELLMQNLMDLKYWHGNSLTLAGELHDRIEIYLKLPIAEDQVAPLLDLSKIWKLFQWRCCICCRPASPTQQVNLEQVEAASMLVRLPVIGNWKELHELLSGQGQVGSNLEDSRQLANEYMHLAADKGSFRILLLKTDCAVATKFVIDVLRETVSDFEKRADIMSCGVTEKDLAELSFAKDLMNGTERNPVPEVQSARRALNECIVTLSVKHMLQHHRGLTKQRWGGELDLRVAAEVFPTCIVVHKVLEVTEDVNCELGQQAKNLKKYTVTCMTTHHPGAAKFSQVIQIILNGNHYDYVGPAGEAEAGGAAPPVDMEDDKQDHAQPQQLFTYRTQSQDCNGYLELVHHSYAASQSTAPFRTTRPGGSTGHFNMSPARVVSLLANLIEKGRFGNMGTLIDAGAGLGYVVFAMQVVSATLGQGFAVIGVEPESSILRDVSQARKDALFKADLDSSNTLHYITANITKASCHDLFQSTLPGVISRDSERSVVVFSNCEKFSDPDKVVLWNDVIHFLTREDLPPSSCVVVTSHPHLAQLYSECKVTVYFTSIPADCVQVKGPTDRTWKPNDWKGDIRCGDVLFVIEQQKPPSSPRAGQLDDDAYNNEGDKKVRQEEEGQGQGQACKGAKPGLHIGDTPGSHCIAPNNKRSWDGTRRNKAKPSQAAGRGQKKQCTAEAAAERRDRETATLKITVARSQLPKARKELRDRLDRLDTAVFDSKCATQDRMVASAEMLHTARSTAEGLGLGLGEEGLLSCDEETIMRWRCDEETIIKETAAVKAETAKVKAEEAATESMETAIREMQSLLAVVNAPGVEYPTELKEYATKVTLHKAQQVKAKAEREKGKQARAAAKSAIKIATAAQVKCMNEFAKYLLSLGGAGQEMHTEVPLNERIAKRMARRFLKTAAGQTNPKVTVAWHWCKEKTYDEKIRKYGLLNTAEREACDGTVGNEHGLVYGDGVYVAKQPFAFATYGDVLLCCLILPGNERELTEDEERAIHTGTGARRCLPPGFYNARDEHGHHNPNWELDTLIGNKTLATHHYDATLNEVDCYLLAYYLLLTVYSRVRSNPNSMAGRASLWSSGHRCYSIP